MTEPTQKQLKAVYYKIPGIDTTINGIRISGLFNSASRWIELNNIPIFILEQHAPIGKLTSGYKLHLKADYELVIKLIDWICELSEADQLCSEVKAKKDAMIKKLLDE